MKKLLVLLSVFVLGSYLGWQARTLLPEKELTVTNVNLPEKNHTVDSLKSDDYVREAGPTVKDILFSPQLLSSDQIGIVLELLKQDMSAEEKTEINQQLIRYGESLIDSSKSMSFIERKLSALLGNEDTKTAIMDLLARFYERRHRFDLAVDMLYQMRFYANYSDERQEINQRIKTLSNRHIDTLKAKNEIDNIREFYEHLILKEPDNYEIQMQFAEFEFLNGNYDRSQQLLDVLVHHSEYSQQAIALLTKNEHQISLLKSGGVPVPVIKQGDHFIVSAVVNDLEPIKLIIDTGASITVLAPYVVQSLGIQEEDALKLMDFNTANGIVTAPVVNIEKLNIQNHVVRNLRVGVLPAFNNSNIQGLLGMNFLRQFSFFINQENLTLELSPSDAP